MIYSERKNNSVLDFQHLTLKNNPNDSGNIFDFDGVIVESADIKTNAFAELFEREGKDAEEKVVEYHLKNAGCLDMISSNISIRKY